DAQKKEIAECDVLMVDGNDLEGAIEASKYAHTVGTKVLYDAGGRYEGVERLLPLVDILIPSEEFACGISGKDTPEEAVVWMYNEYNAEVVVATCGKRGGVMYKGDEVISYPALPADVVDSNGAGDVFHGAFAYASTVYDDYYNCCIFSSAVSALKCMGIGARESVPDLETVQKYLKENGYEF
ncbi:MAG: carbohydrate kinase family protein, partial [Clostridia bacterium]|nr:carbohydrate kinase family protein [Clostridia bacterium]